jgi:hypothetical protein
MLQPVGAAGKYARRTRVTSRQVVGYNTSDA